MMNRKLVPILLVILAGFGVYALHNFIVRSEISDNRIGNIITFGIYNFSGILLRLIKRRLKTLSDIIVYFFLFVGIFFDAYGLFYNRDLFPVIVPISTIIKIIGFYLGYNVLKRTKVFYIVLIGSIPALLYVGLVYIPTIEYEEQNNDFKPLLKQVNYSILKTQNGDTIDQRSFRGKVVLLDFYFMNCKPCREKFPALEKLKSAFNNRNDVEIIGVYCDVDHSIEELPAFLEMHKITMKTYIDKDLSLCKELGIKSYPVEFILNKNGEIVSTYWGFLMSASDKYIEERIELINELLKSK